ncbi:MAG: signal peptide peptidase SppA [Pseudomonadota bacterium]
MDLKPAIKRILRFAITAGGIFVMLSLVVFGTSYYALTKKPDIPDEAVLYLTLDRPVVEQPVLPALSGITKYVIGQNPELSSNEIARVIRTAGADPRIKRIVLDMDGMSVSGPGPIETLIWAVRDAKAQGTEVYAYASNYSTLTYLLAAQADRVLLNDMGSVDWNGLSYNAVFFGDALERLGVKVFTAQAGKYKSAIEPYVRSGFSQEARTVMQETLSALWDGFIGYAAAGRGIPKEDLAAIAEQGLLVTEDPAQTSLELGLVDDLVSPPALSQLATAKGAAKQKGPYDTVDMATWSDFIGKPTCEADTIRKTGETQSGGRISIITLSGQIRMGRNAPGIIGAHSTVGLLRAAGYHPDTAGIILRIDSPGGDAQASEIIRATIMDIKQRGVPVIVSMGSVTASGGYWIASAADRVFADQLTTTGSVGAFALLPSAADALSRYGVETDTITVAGGGSSVSLAAPVSQRVLAQLQTRITGVYERFIATVADGRSLSIEDTRAAAGGRVWSAKAAQDRSLVDEIGSLEAAIQYTVRQVNTERSCAVHIRLPVNTADILQQLSQPTLPVALTEFNQAGRVRTQCLTCSIWSEPFEVGSDSGNIKAVRSLLASAIGKAFTAK